MATIEAQIRLREVRLTPRIGVGTEERSVPRTILADLSFRLDLPLDRNGRTADELGATVDYAAIYQLARTVAGEKPYLLLETLAVELYQRVRETFPEVRELRVACAKPGPPVGGEVGAAEVSVGGEGVPHP